MAAGFLDPSFDGDGRLSLPAGPAAAVAVQGDGKIVTAGGTETLGGDFLVYRFNADGSADQSFGLGGVVGTDIAGRADIARAIALQGDGKIIVAGSSDGEFALARYNANGSPDTTFGTNGVVTTPFGADATALDVAIQDDGKIVAAGRSSATAGGTSTFALVRYNADGSLDTSFDGDGKVTTGFGLTAANSVAMAPGGRIVAGGTAETNHGDAALVRYLADGSLDPTFGPFPDFGTDVPPPGVVRSAFEAYDGYDEIRDVAVDTDGTILAAGQIEGQGFVLSRFDQTGLFPRRYESPEFAGGPGGGASNGSAATAVTFDAQGRVVAAGYTMDSAGRPENVALVRFNTEGESDGVIDRTFGFRGTAVTDFRAVVAGADPQDTATGIGLAPGGAIVVAGASGSRGVVARYLGAADSSPAPVRVSADNALAVDGTAGADDVRLYPWTETVPRFVADLNGSLFLAPRGVGRARVNTLAGNDYIRALGTAFNFPVEADGGAGNDTITGGGADDMLWGRDGNDFLTGGAGNDILLGGSGADAVFGGDGNDVIVTTEAGAPVTFENDYYSGGRGPTRSTIRREAGGC